VRPRGVAGAGRAGALLALCALLAAGHPAGAQAPEPRPAEPEQEAEAGAKKAPATPAELLAKVVEQREAIARELAELKAREAAALGEEASALASELNALETTDGGLAQLALVLEASEKLAAREASTEPPAAVASLGEPPYGLADLDGLQEALDAVTERRTRRLAASQVVKSELDAASAELQRLEEARRLAREALAAPAPGAELEVRRRLRLAELESRRAEVRRDVVARTLENSKRELTLVERDEAALRAALERVRAALRVEPEELRAALADVDTREGRLERELERARAESAERQSRLVRAQATLDATPPPAAALAAEVSARRADAQVAALRVTLLEDQLARTKGERETWRERYQVLAGELGRREIRTLDARLTHLAEGLESARRIWSTGLDEMRSDAREARERSEKAAAERSETAPWREREARSFEEGVAAIEGHIEDLGRSRRLVARAVADVEDRLVLRGLGGLVDGVTSKAAELWDRELAAVDDRPITIGKVVVALGLMALGYLGSRLLSRLVGRLMRRRSRAAEGGVKAVESLAFYLLLTLFVLLSLDYVNIPLTAFTLLGGALAVGVGFGSQNLMNNFMSGLILLTERPIQVGDIVEIDGTQGTVDRIGPRSTRIRTFDNIHLIVPNSAFLEKNVVNWTMSDNTVRAMVEVGVAYGSETREVTKLLRRVMDEHGQILEDPEPIVLFHEFGPSSLVFRAYFWVQMRDVTQRGRIASDVRYRIDRLFAEAGIAIAFPQHDVHLDTTRPLEVRLAPAEPPAAGAAAVRGEGKGAQAAGAPGPPRGEEEGDGVGP
jgi:small-conductance mechanosensitive channel